METDYAILLGVSGPHADELQFNAAPTTPRDGRLERRLLSAAETFAANSEKALHSRKAGHAG